MLARISRLRKDVRLLSGLQAGPNGCRKRHLLRYFSVSQHDVSRPDPNHNVDTTQAQTSIQLSYGRGINRRGVIHRDIVSTLDPAKLTPSDYFDLSNRTTSYVFFPGQTDNGLRLTHNVGDGAWRFPENARGFLYFHREPGKPVVQTGLRFRLATTPTLLAFHSGSDLKVRIGISDWPWSIGLLQLVGSDKYRDVLARLLSEGLVSAEEVRLCRNIIKNSGITRPTVHTTRRPVLRSMTEPFVINLEEQYLHLYLIDEGPSSESLTRLVQPSPFVVGQTYIPAYRGRCLVQFERVSSRRTPKGAIRCNIRILEILSPIERICKTDMKVPEEGALAARTEGPVQINVAFRSQGRATSFLRNASDLPVSTLQLPLTQRTDIRDMSGQGHQRVHFANSDEYAIFSYRGRNKFPPNTIGYLYYYRPSTRPSISGEIRFRLVASRGKNPSKSTKDLMDATGSGPWSLPLIVLVNGSIYKGFLSMLLREKLVSREDIELCQRILASPDCPRKFHSTTTLVFGAGYPFLLDFSRETSQTLRFINLDPPNVHNWLHTLTRDTRTDKVAQNKSLPYRGKCMVQFEEALPEDGTGQKKSYYVRVLEIIEPFRVIDRKYDGLIGMPKKGEYLQREGKPVVVDSFTPPIY